jgi:thioredoxin 1
VIVLTLIIAVGAVMAVKHYNAPSWERATAAANNTAQDIAGSGTGLPRLIELGADKCVPCKMMAPILEELKHEYEGRLQVDFYDVWKDPSAGERFGIQVIPTQIFLDPDGNELFRHVGFFSKDEILAKWQELGFALRKSSQ